MKKILAMLLAGVMLLTCLVACGKKDDKNDDVELVGGAQESVYNGFAYETNKDGDFTIIGYRKETTSESTLSIPATIDERPVTGIANGAFKANLAKSISIPEGIVTIGDTAFYDCDNLTAVKIPSTVTKVGKAAFSNCEKLSYITLSSEMTEIADYTFRDCVSLTAITVTDKITSIGAGAFMGCTALKNVALPAGLTDIGDAAFVNCPALSAITLPAGLTNIGTFIFSKEAGTKLTVTAGSKAEEYAQTNEYIYVAK